MEGQGNFCKLDNELKFTNIWELAHLPKSTGPHKDQAVDFISDRSFFIFTNSESWQNFRSYDILHVYVAML